VVSDGPLEGPFGGGGGGSGMAPPGNGLRIGPLGAGTVVPGPAPPDVEPDWLGTGAPHEVQNPASGGRGFPHLVQNAAATG
jgi:hypothetical protein